MKVLLLEASLNRVMQHLTSHKRIAILSASRKTDSKGKPLSKNVLKARTARASKQIQNMGYGFVRVHGRSGEVQADGSTVRASEMSFLVPGMKHRDAVRVGKRFWQDEVIWKGRGKKSPFKFVKTHRRTGGKIGSSSFSLNKPVPGTAQYDTAVAKKSGWNKPRATPKKGKLPSSGSKAFHLE